MPSVCDLMTFKTFLTWRTLCVQNRGDLTKKHVKGIDGASPLITPHPNTLMPCQESAHSTEPDCRGSKERATLCSRAGHDSAPPSGGNSPTGQPTGQTRQDKTQQTATDRHSMGQRASRQTDRQSRRQKTTRQDTQQQEQTGQQGGQATTNKTHKPNQDMQAAR